MPNSGRRTGPAVSAASRCHACSPGSRQNARNDRLSDSTTTYRSIEGTDSYSSTFSSSRRRLPRPGETTSNTTIGAGTATAFRCGLEHAMNASGSRRAPPTVSIASCGPYVSQGAPAGNLGRIESRMLRPVVGLRRQELGRLTLLTPPRKCTRDLLAITRSPGTGGFRSARVVSWQDEYRADHARSDDA